ncbi:hypothetical protein, partial [Dickeya lacustris]|uniref:hypothetical protein n=1 Tax=Dickeya lacustris TaxID=2259638 RepID=UPI0022BA3C01
IVKEQCDRPEPAVARWRILRFPIHEESTFIFVSSSLTPRCVAAVAVSVEAHYRDFLRPDKP